MRLFRGYICKNLILLFKVIIKLQYNRENTTNYVLYFITSSMTFSLPLSFFVPSLISLLCLSKCVSFCILNIHKKC